MKGPVYGHEGVMQNRNKRKAVCVTRNSNKERLSERCCQAIFSCIMGKTWVRSVKQKDFAT